MYISAVINVIVRRILLFRNCRTFLFAFSRATSTKERQPFTKSRKKGPKTYFDFFYIFRVFLSEELEAPSAQTTL